MTLIIAWAAAQHTRKKDITSALYIASDSRISWGEKYDYGKKLFVCKNNPDIFGYCGDVLFPLQILSQIVDGINEGIIYNNNDALSNEKKAKIIKHILNTTIKDYPKDYGINKNGLTIIHGTKDMDKRMSLYKYEWNRKNGLWYYETIKQTSTFSQKLFCGGTGKNEFERNFEQLIKDKGGEEKVNSSDIFHCFCQTLIGVKDKSCGGAPQLATLKIGKNGNGQMLGVVYDNNLYFGGLPLKPNAFLTKSMEEKARINTFSWYNENLKKCNPKTKLLLEKNR